MLAKQRRSTVSELVREAVQEKYLGQPANRAELLQSIIGAWKRRDDLGDSTEYVRRLRKGSRLSRLWK